MEPLLIDLVNPPPIPKHTLDYPIELGLISLVILSIVLIIVSAKFDHTGGALTISLILILAFCGALAFSLDYTIPQDPTTAAIVGGLVSQFGVIIGFWLGKRPPNGGTPKSDS